jgi:hypothetical protein
MRNRLVVAVCTVLSGLAVVDPGAAPGAGHTPTACWAVPREYHERYTGSFAKGLIDLAKHVRVESVPLSDPPTRTPSPNGAYWFAEELPDFTRPGPWTTRLLVFNERRTLAQLSFIDHANGDIRANWVNEKLLFVRVWWGRIVATDLIFDVEKGRFVYREVLWHGLIAFQQWEEHGSPCVLPPGQFSK